MKAIDRLHHTLGKPRDSSPRKFVRAAKSLNGKTAGLERTNPAVVKPKRLAGQPRLLV
jgi:hypothetical protein